jgi:antitoxin YefM
MRTLPATDTQAALYSPIDEVAATHEPVLIEGKRNNSVLVSEDDWRAINETLYLLSLPGMRESIREGMATPLDECSEEAGLL